MREQEGVTQISPKDERFRNLLDQAYAITNGEHADIRGTLPDGTPSRYMLAGRTKGDGKRGRSRLKKTGEYATPEVMLERHRRIAQMIVMGIKDKDICETLGISTQTLYKVKGTAGVQDLIKTLQTAEDIQVKTIAEQIQEKAQTALDVVSKAVDGELENLDDKDRVNAAFKLLDMAGYGAVKKVAVRTQVQVLNKEGVSKLLEKARQADMIDVQDAEIEEVKQITE